MNRTRFAPVSVGPLRIRNRVVTAPTTGRRANADGQTVLEQINATASVCGQRLLAEVDEVTVYTPDAEGYVDYPAWGESRAS